MITEEELIDKLPFTAEWTQAQRVCFVAGIEALDAAPMASPDTSDLAGLIIANTEAGARACGWFSKARIAECAAPFVELDPGTISAIYADKPPGTVDIIGVIDRYEFVFCLPIAVVRVMPPGSEDN